MLADLFFYYIYFASIKALIYDFWLRSTGPIQVSGSMLLYIFVV